MASPAAAAGEGDDFCSGLGLKASDVPVAQGGLSGGEWLLLVTYILSIGLILRGPPHLFERQWRAWGQEPPWWTEAPVYGPIVGLLFLAATSALFGHELITDHAVQETLAAKVPIILLILSFAYLSISLDVSGFFQATAAYIVGLARGDGHRLLVYTFLLASFLTYFTSNDIVIISMTPLIMHVGDCSSISDAVPLLVTQFVAANTASSGLLVGSPTNIILGDAIKLSFLHYWLLMLLPTAVAIAATLAMLLAVFVWFPTRRHRMARHFTMRTPGEEEKEEDAGAVDADEGGRRPVAAAVELTDGELGGDGLELKTTAPLSPAHVAASAATDGGESGVQEGGSTPPPNKALLMTAPGTRAAKVLVFATVLLLLSVAQFIRLELWTISFISALAMLVVDLGVVHADKGSKLAFLAQVYARMPWAIAPFVLCMFLLVRALTDAGFTGRFAKGMVKAGGDNVWSQSMVYGSVSGLLVNVMVDLPSTVFWSGTLPFLCASYDRRSFHVILQALLIGVNIGKYLSIMGALAGIMWISLINSNPSAKRLVVPSALDLSYYGAMVLGPVMVVTCLSISLQSCLRLYT